MPHSIRRIPTTGSVIVFMLCFIVALPAATVTWDGSSSSDWSVGANWDTGTAPGSGDVVVLTGSGSAPTNQNITGLNVQRIDHDGLPDGTTISGEKITFSSKLHEGTNSINNITYENDIRLEGSGRSFKANDVTFNGVLSGPSTAEMRLKRGKFSFRNLNNTFNGERFSTVIGSTFEFFGDGSIGTAPTNFEPNFFDNGTSSEGGGTKLFSRLQGDHGIYEIDANRGLEIDEKNDSKIEIQEQQKVIFNGNISQESGIPARFNKTGNGELVLTGDNNNFKGDINADGGVLTLDSSNASGSADASAELDLNGGTLDLNGYDLDGRDIAFRNNEPGFKRSGGLVNRDTSTPVTLSGDVVDFGSVSQSISFGGPGDIILTGTINDDGGTGIDKVGTGTLTIRGTNNLGLDSGNSSGTDLRNGTLVLDYLNGNNNRKLGKPGNPTNGNDYTLNMRGATLRIEGNNSENETINLSNLNVEEDNSKRGANNIELVSHGQDLTLKLGSITNRDMPLHFDIDESGGGTAIINTATTNQGISGTLSQDRDFFYNKSNWAEVDASGNVQAFTGLVSASTANDFETAAADSLIDIQNSISVDPNGTGDERVLGLRFNQATSTTLTLANGLNLGGRERDSSNNAISGTNETAAILVTDNAGAVNINNGSLFTDVNNALAIAHYGSSDLTINSQVDFVTSGNSVTKIGSGRLVLTNDNSRFSELNIYEGTVAVDSVSSGGSSSSAGEGADILITQATFEYTGSTDQTTDVKVNIRGDATLKNSGTGTITFAGNDLSNNAVSSDFANFDKQNNMFNLTLDGSGDGVIEKVDIGAGKLIKNGTGEWTLKESNFFFGGIDINGGTLSGEADSLKANTVTNNGTLEFAQTSNQSYYGSITGSGDLVKTGTGTTTLRAQRANTYTGNTTVSNGKLSLNMLGPDTGGRDALGDGTGNVTIESGGEVEVVGNNQINDDTDVTVNSSGTFTLNGEETISVLDNSGTVTVNENLTATDITGAGTGSIAIANTKTLTAINDNASTYSGTMSGAGSLTKEGTNTLTLAGSSANTYTGATTVSDGTLALNKSAGTDALGDGTGDVTIESGAEVEILANNQINNNTNIVLDGGTLTLGNDVSEGGTTDNTSGINKLQLNANSDLAFATDDTKPSIINIADLDTGTSNLRVLNWDGDTGGIGSGDRFLLDDDSLTNVSRSDIEFSGFGVTGKIVDSGIANVKELVPDIDEFVWEGDTAGSKDLWGEGDNWDGGVSPSNIGETAVFDDTGNSQLTVNIPGSTTGTTTTISRIEIKDNDYTIQNDNTMQDNTIQLEPEVSGVFTAVDVSGSNVTAEIASNLIIADSSEFDVNNINSKLTVSGDISESGGPFGITKKGTGTLELSGTSSFTGDTTVEDGTLNLSGSHYDGVAPGDLIINGGTLMIDNESAFDNTTGGGSAVDVTLGGGTLAFQMPDSDANGTFELGALTLTADSKIDFGNDNLQLDFTGSVTGLDSNQLDIYSWNGNPYGPAGPDQLFFSGDKTLPPGELSNIRFFKDAGTNMWGPPTVQNSSTGEVKPVPEASTWIIGSLMSAWLLFHAYRRRAAGRCVDNRSL